MELELQLGDAVHNFCSSVCLDAFCWDAVGVCDVCSATCRQNRLTVKLEDATKTVCSSECLVEFKEVQKEFDPMLLQIQQYHLYQTNKDTEKQKNSDKN